MGHDPGKLAKILSQHHLWDGLGHKQSETMSCRLWHTQALYSLVGYHALPHLAHRLSVVWIRDHDGHRLSKRPAMSQLV